MPEISINPRAQSLIAELDLQPHPEGGYYREIFRSESRVQPGDHRAGRSALTAIYFLPGRRVAGSASLGGIRLVGLLCRAGFRFQLISHDEGRCGAEPCYYAAGRGVWLACEA